MFKGNQYKLASVGTLHARKTESFQSQLLKTETFCVTVGQDVSEFQSKSDEMWCGFEKYENNKKNIWWGPGAENRAYLHHWGDIYLRGGQLSFYPHN